jgi:indole-3-glycerol phosphate synthase
MGFLADVVAEIRADVRRPDYLDGVPASRASRPVPSLRGAIERAGTGGALLVEFKRISPGSDDPVLPARSPASFVAGTRGAEVAAYSCVATRPRFGGSPRDVAELVAATDRPVLFKDFVVGETQLDAATRAGASAILLIARLESTGALDAPLPALARTARARGLEVLLELHDTSDLKRAADVPADVYGVNVRDLDTLRMEPEIAAATIRAVRDRRPLAGLSGVRGPEDATRFWDLGVDAILVGTAVGRAADPIGFLRGLRRAPRSVR